MIAFFFWYGAVCAGCLAVAVGSVVLTLVEGCVRQRLRDRATQREQRAWPTQDAALAKARQCAELRQRQAADLEEWRRELGWTKR